MKIRQYLEEKRIEKDWSTEALRHYQVFAVKVMKNSRLKIYTGVGGISFYKPAPDKPVFLVHFVARPRRFPSRMGYLDFRKSSLKRWLSPQELLETLKREAGPNIILQEGKDWCGMYFPLSRTPEIADLIERAIVSKVQVGAETFVVD